MKKIDRFLDSLTGHEVEAKNGEIGYFVTVGELIDNGGKNEFFRTTRKGKDGTFSVSRNIFHNLEYDASERKWYGDDFCDISGGSKGLLRDSVVFIGFTF